MDQVEFECRYGRVGRAANGAMEQQQQQSQQQKPSTKTGRIKSVCGTCCCTGEGTLADSITRLMPILSWLPKYNCRKNLHCDLITGLTVGIMVVPQGMAYATLAKVPPVYGLYSCFFAALFYMFFGTSPHISIGTFAVASMMVGNVRTQLAPEPTITREMINGTLQEVTHHVNGTTDFGHPVDPLVLTSALTLGVGLCQLLMALCRLSFLTNYISDPLVSGFTTGAAVHVLTSQLDKLIGVKIKGHHGPGMILFMWRDILMAAKHANPWTLGISAFGLGFLSVGRDYFNPWFQRHFRIPFPLELFLVIAAIIFSHLLGFKQNYGVRIVDHVPDGMPLPALPQVELLPYIWLDAFTISIVCYVFVFSLDKIFAKKHKYKLDPNQELYALGLCSVLSAFFPVYPFGASLSRSSLCEMTGAKTPLHAIFSSSLLLVVILWIGPWLEPLPMAILACIVAVSLKNLFLQFRELPKLWRISHYDFAIWLVAFAATAFLDITYGLVISVLFSVFTVVFKEQWPDFNRLGEANNGIFRPLQFYTDLASTDDNVQVWHFGAPLHFANAPKFVECVTDICQQIEAAAGMKRQTQHSPRLIIKVTGDGPMEEDASIGMTLNDDGSVPKKKINCPHCLGTPVCGCRRPSQAKRLATENSILDSGIGVDYGDDEEEGRMGEMACRDCDKQMKKAHRNSRKRELHQHEPLLLQQQQRNEWDAGNGKNFVSNNVFAQPASTAGDISHSQRQHHQHQHSSTHSIHIKGTLIIDCAAIAHIDAVGVDALIELYKEAKRVHVALKFAAFSDALLTVFHRCALFEFIPEQQFFPSIPDALNSGNQ